MSAINIVWLKRDLRLRDHEPLYKAVSSSLPFIIIYMLEPIMMEDEHMDVRHWRFISQSLQDMDMQLREYHASRSAASFVHIMHGDAISVLNQIAEKYDIKSIFSHQEIGLDHTFERDKQVARWCKSRFVDWQESVYGAVKRPLSNRTKWQAHWYGRIMSAVSDPDLNSVSELCIVPSASSLNHKQVPTAWLEHAENFQLGGEKRAWHTLKHFFTERGKAYFGNIGNPTVARKTCSRLSPYLAWGNISLKQVYQYSQQYKQRKGWRKSVAAFTSRLHWHCHFIQKFESESAMEQRPVNRAYIHFPYETGDTAKQRLEHWQNATTGIPIIDACMKAVQATGYINFRMRAMLVSFLCHHLNIDWRQGVTYLGSQFLDFEPGIHYPQFQMQAGITGTNIIRLYNPVKQSQDKDPDATFITKWLPVLEVLPKEMRHTPWLLNPMEQQLYNFNLGEDYPAPIIDIEQAAREARDRLWRYRERDDVKQEARRVLFTHSVLT